MGFLDTADWGTFKRSETWKALGIAVVLFGTIAYASLSLFGSLDALFQSDAEPEPIPEMVFESLNRTGIEDSLANETGWFTMSDLRGDVIILDFMAHDCSNCHAVQAHLEAKMQGWKDLAASNGVGFHVLAYGAWYTEDLAYLNTSGGAYTVPTYPTGLGSANAAKLANGTADPVRLFTPSGTGTIPVVMIVDEDGYIVHRQNTGAPTDGWSGFDAAVEHALAAILESGEFSDAAVASSGAQAAAFWHLREAMSEAQKIAGGSIKHDIAVPVAAVPDFLDAALPLVRRVVPGCRPCPFGHLGDGNLHFNISQGEGVDTAAFLARRADMNAAVFDLVGKFGGSVSAEHGIGVDKRALLPSVKSPVEIALMRQVKAMLDPLDIMNPGKVL